MKTISYHRKKIFLIPMGLAAVALFSLVTMLLWNAILPALFQISTLTFWQAAGLLILARLLFGSFHSKWHGWPGTHMNSELRSKIMKMSPEEKKEFFRKMHYDRKVWHREHFSDKENNGEKPVNE